MPPFITAVTNIKEIAEKTLLLKLACPLNFNFQAGQFVTLQINNGIETKARAYSILNPPREKGVIELCFRLVENGFASTVFAKTKVGDQFKTNGPFGRLILEQNTAATEHIFMATGTGMVPFYSMLQEHIPKYLESKEKIKFHLLWGLRYKKDVFLEEELSNLQKKYLSFQYDTILSREDWPGKRGHVQQHLPKDLTNKIFYLCGSGVMIDETKALLLQKSVPKENIIIEKYY